MSGFNPTEIELPVVFPMRDGDTISFAFSTPHWNIYDTTFGVFGEDVDAIYEMMEAAEHEHFDRLHQKICKVCGDFEVSQIFCPANSWWDYHPDCVSVLPDYIAETLQEAEEDFEYEQWINSKQYKKSLQESNFHKLASCEKGYASSPWTGTCVEDNATTTTSQGKSCVLYETFFKDRYNLDVEIVTHHPPNKKGYAKGTTDYGDVYIPFKFWKYLPSIGATTKMSVALQDVGGGGKKANGFRWTAIYQHDPTYK